MENLEKLAVWSPLMRAKKIQGVCGIVSGALLTLALLALFDGLLAQMRAGNNSIDMLAGSSIALSGPVAIKNPVQSDLIFRFTPSSPAPQFVFEGYFTGYWFGSGMWRGEVEAPADLSSGEYQLSISFKGSSAKSAQIYKINVFHSPDEMRYASYSFLTLVFDINPFTLAAVCGLSGAILGMITYFFGRKVVFGLAALGLAQTQMDRDGRLWCVCPEDAAPPRDALTPLFNESGLYLGEGQAGAWLNGRLEIFTQSNILKANPAFACLRLAPQKEGSGGASV